jgi:Sulfotransferase family
MALSSVDVTAAVRSALRQANLCQSRPIAGKDADVAKSPSQVAATMIDALVPRRHRLGAAELTARAQRRTGLADFGGAPFEEPLQNFLRACREEGDLTLFGRLATRWDVVRFLSNLLRLRDEERRDPGILDQPIERPIFIAGLPRSGTTFLHTLLAQDPANLVPRVWQLIHPYPDEHVNGRDLRQRRVARQLRLFGLIAREFRHMHPIDADSPQECSEITAHVFASLRFDTTYHIPRYRRWLDDTGHLDAYRFHKRFLQHLQRQAATAGQWVLKCPDHIFALPALRTVYPDACIVFVHRDPLAVLASVARLTEVLRRPFSRHIDRIEIGHQDSDRWLAATELMIAAAEGPGFAEPIFHLHYRNLVGDPLGTVAALYRHFGRMLDPHAAARIGRLVAAKPNGGYGARRSRLEEYGLDPALERARYARYMRHFKISSEREASPSRPARIAAPLAPEQSSETKELSKNNLNRGDDSRTVGR